MNGEMELWDGGPRFLQAEHAKIGTDSILLADFVRVSGKKKGLDLGCASGILALLLLALLDGIAMTGLEILPEAAALAKENMARSGFSDRSEMRCGDLRRVKEMFPTGAFDFIVTNPPYFACGSGKLAPQTQRAQARGEVTATLADVLNACAYLLPTGGKLFLCYRPERLSELLCTMSACGIEPKRLRMAAQNARQAPGLVLVEGCRGGRVGLTVEPMLLLRDESGAESAEYRRIYHRE